jgi:hypothetical protein
VNPVGQEKSKEQNCSRIGHHLFTIPQETSGHKSSQSNTPSLSPSWEQSLGSTFIATVASPYLPSVSFATSFVVYTQGTSKSVSMIFPYPVSPFQKVQLYWYGCVHPKANPS